MAEIKSALELALEKAERLGRATKEELLQEQYHDKGRQLAVQYLKEEGDLEEGLAKLPPEGRETARQAIKEVLLRNIALPRDQSLDPRVTLALKGMLVVASNKKGMTRLKEEVQQLLENYLMARNSALEAQYGQKLRVEVEHLPQFQEEWRKFETNLIQQFEPILEDRKARMKTL